MARGFGGLGDMAKLMKQAQKMQSDMVEAQKELEESRVEATSGGGVVKAVVSGKGKLVSVTINPDVVDPADVEMLQDLIVSAIREAEEKAEAIELDKMQSMTGGMNLPQGLF